MIGSTGNAWFSASWEAWGLGMETSTVIALRTIKVAMGRDKDGREARLMVAEKIRTAMEVQIALMTGSLGLDPAVATHGF